MRHESYDREDLLAAQWLSLLGPWAQGYDFRRGFIISHLDEREREQSLMVTFMQMAPPQGATGAPIAEFLKSRSFYPSYGSWNLTSSAMNSQRARPIGPLRCLATIMKASRSKLPSNPASLSCVSLVVVIGRPVQEDHHIGVLLDVAGVAQMIKAWFFRVGVLDLTVQLME